MNILFAGVECFPFVKIGGLGDVLGSLPNELNSLGEDARVILPKYKTIKRELLEKIKFLEYFYVKVGQASEYVGLFELKYNKVKYYFIDNEKYFGRDKVYGFSDEYDRWAFFEIAIVEAIKHFKDFKVDILNANDWHTGMIPYLIKNNDSAEIRNIKTVFTIHNILYQGECDKGFAQIFNLPFDSTMELNGNMNIMKCAILNADSVNTVSEQYKNELLSSDYFAMGLKDALNEVYNKGLFSGILNGIDYNIFNPKKDGIIPMKYSYSTYKEGKLLAKEELNKRMNITFNNDYPLMSIVSRLTKQKGLDLIVRVIDEMINDDKRPFNFFILGNGERQFEDFFYGLECRYKDRVKFYNGYSDELAHIVYAASDLFLMPSAFEPCGLGQMIALKYGTLPIVRETGGLKDSVEPFNEYEMKGNGFSFTNFNAHDMMYTIRYALDKIKRKKNRNLLVKNAMNSDYSFKASAIKYLDLYKKVKSL